MKKMKKILFLLLILIIPFTFSYKVKADEILEIENVKQVENSYNVEFNVISNYEVSTKYENLGDTLEFEIKIKNKSSDYNAILKDLTILNTNEGVDYSATLDKTDLELEPSETRTIRVTGILNSNATDGTEIVKLQLHYNISKAPCKDCNKDIDVIVNPKTGDNISRIIILSILGTILIALVIVALTRKKAKASIVPILIISIGLLLNPIRVKADEEFLIEFIINQRISINKMDNTITVTEVTKPYDGDPIDGEFENDSNTPVTPIYYEDDECQNPIDGKPTNAGIYYATGTSEGNTWYKEGTLECTKAVTITKLDSTCPEISNVTKTYDGNEYSLTIGEGLDGGTLKYSLDNETWSNSISKTNAGEYTIYTKVVGDSNHNDKACGTNTITINKEVDSITVTEVVEPYTGNPIDGEFESTSGSPITPTYYTDNTCETPINGKPTNTGIYYASAISDGNNNYNPGELGCSKSVTINKVDSTCPATQNVNVDYDGENHSIVVGTGLVGGTLNYSTNNSDWSTETINKVYPGEYIVYTKVIGDNNHNDKTCGTNTIKINKLDDTITVTEVVEPYSGNEVNGTFNTISNLEVTPTYYTDNTCETEVIGKIKNAGTYYATGTTVGNDIYNSATLSCSKAITITKVASTCPTIENVTATYTGQYVSLNVGSGLDGGTLNYSLNDGEWTTDAVSVKDVGTYNIKTKVVGDNNHGNTDCGTNTITINKMDDVISVSTVTATYSGSPVDGTFSSTSNLEVTPTYYTDNTCETPINGKPTNAGDYYATATTEGNELYKPAELSCTKAVTISKAESTCPTIENVNVYYDENNHSLIIGDGINGGTLYYSINDGEWTATPIAVSEVGTYTINTKVVGDSNHSDKSCGTNTINIAKKLMTITTENQSKVYDGDPLVADSTCSIVGDYDGYSVECTTSGSITNVGEVPKVIESVTIYDDNNHDVTNLYSLNQENGTLTITAERTAYEGECNDELVYDGTTHSLADWGYRISYTNNEGTDAGTYSIIATADPNYAFEDGTTVKTLTCTIEKANLAIVAAPQTIKYGTSISKTLADVDSYGLAAGHNISTATLTQERTAVITREQAEYVDQISLCGSDSYYYDYNDGVQGYVENYDSVNPLCLGIGISNATVTDSNNEDVTKNYNVSYKKGILSIYYEINIVAGPHCSINDTPYTTSFYTSEPASGPLDSTISADIGYKMIGWKKGDAIVDACADDLDDYPDGECYTFENEELIFTGNETYTAVCEDKKAPQVNSFYEDEYYDYGDIDRTKDFVIYTSSSDAGSGVNKIEVYYRRCGDANFTKAPDITFGATDSSYDYVHANTCLKYGTYYVYAVVYDAAGNSTTTDVVEASLRAPNAKDIKLRSASIGTNCNSMDCSLDELFDYFDYREYNQ